MCLDVIRESSPRKPFSVRVSPGQKTKVFLGEMHAFSLGTSKVHCTPHVNIINQVGVDMFKHVVYERSQHISTVVVCA